MPHTGKDELHIGRLALEMNHLLSISLVFILPDCHMFDLSFFNAMLRYHV